MDKQKKLIAALVKEIAAARTLIAETEKALVESETKLIETLGEFSAMNSTSAGMTSLHAIPGFVDCNVDWNMVAIARNAFLQRIKVAFDASQGANHE